MCPVVTRKKCVTKGLQCVSVSVITTVCCCFWSFCPLRAKAKCLTFQLSLNKKINYNWEECENVKRLPCCYLFASTGNYKNYKLVKQLAPARQRSFSVKPFKLVSLTWAVRLQLIRGLKVVVQLLIKVCGVLYPLARPILVWWEAVCVICRINHSAGGHRLAVLDSQHTKAVKVIWFKYSDYIKVYTRHRKQAYKIPLLGFIYTNLNWAV